MTYHSKKSSSLKTNLWNSWCTLSKFEIINRKEPLRYLKNTTDPEPHASYNPNWCLLHSTNTHDTWYNYRIRQENKNHFFAKETSFRFKNVYLGVAKCLALSKLSSQRDCSTFSVNHIASLLLYHPFASTSEACLF